MGPKVNRLFNTTCKRLRVTRFLKHVRKSRIQFYLQNATRYAMPPASAKRARRADGATLFAVILRSSRDRLRASHPASAFCCSSQHGQALGLKGQLHCCSQPPSSSELSSRGARCVGGTRYVVKRRLCNWMNQLLRGHFG